MARRKRSQVGQRISPWEPKPSPVQLNVACPICMRRSWYHRVFDMVPDGAGGYAPSYDPWEAVPLMYRAMRRWPRKPDGGRGFWWETIPDAEFEQKHAPLIHRVQDQFARRMLRWLAGMGYVQPPNSDPGDYLGMCQSAADCVSDYRCTSAGQCVVGSDDAETDGGCSVSRKDAPTGNGWWLVLSPLGAMLARRRLGVVTARSRRSHWAKYAPTPPAEAEQVPESRLTVDALRRPEGMYIGWSTYEFHVYDKCDLPAQGRAPCRWRGDLLPLGTSADGEDDASAGAVRGQPLGGLAAIVHVSFPRRAP